MERYPVLVRTCSILVNCPGGIDKANGKVYSRSEIVGNTWVFLQQLVHTSKTQIRYSSQCLASLGRVRR